MTAFCYGSLAVCPKVNKCNDMNETNFEFVCVVGSPQMTTGSWIVLRAGTKKPVTRGGLKPILKHKLELTTEQWKALEPDWILVVVLLVSSHQ